MEKTESSKILWPIEYNMIKSSFTVVKHLKKHYNIYLEYLSKSFKDPKDSKFRGKKINISGVKNNKKKVYPNIK